MPQTSIHPQSNAVPIWETAYHDAWHHYQTIFDETLAILHQADASFKERDLVIGKLGQLTLQVHKAQKAGLTMYKKVPGCKTVCNHPADYFTSGFPRRCLGLLQTLHLLTQGLMGKLHNQDRIPDNVSVLDTLMTLWGPRFPKTREFPFISSILFFLVFSQTIQLQWPFYDFTLTIP
ncbi:uncharacterized protein N7529_005864 [Penicillium soppii]|jgi:hypothetical protein|uniref:uncharacterized protein n=1 Tax=Penicillium soppii TaxID=69789 RepID=UPI002549A0AA|nr:uncharacterized protein N7529_005864 [Penicillium soppii]KAJ5863948.1 hypothetical protein N7529_005864 [Penicillium soppii]